jgi:hypothetical protein
MVLLPMHVYLHCSVVCGRRYDIVTAYLLIIAHLASGTFFPIYRSTAESVQVLENKRHDLLSAHSQSINTHL